MHYVFKEGQISGFKFCPMCGAEILEVYPGDYMGHITCLNEECEADLDFDILEARVQRHPKWLVDILMNWRNKK